MSLRTTIFYYLNYLMRSFISKGYYFDTSSVGSTSLPLVETSKVSGVINKW